MGKGRHVVIHDVIHDDYEMGRRPISYQDEFSRIIWATPLLTADWLIVHMSMLVLDRSNVLNDDECGIIEFKVQLQLRLCLSETSSEQPDVFPSSVSISVNGSTCLLQVGSANKASLKTLFTSLTLSNPRYLFAQS